MKKTILLIVALVATMLLAACGPQFAPTSDPDAGQARKKLVLMSHDSFAVSEDVITQFEQETNITVEFLLAGDAGAALNKACLSKGNPLGDVFFGVDNTFLSRAINCGIFEPYRSPALDSVPSELYLDPAFGLLPVDFGYVNLNYDRRWFDEQGLAVPGRLEDLIKPAYKGLLVVENPATSSPGLAFLLTTIAHFGEDGDYSYLDFWRDLRANGVLITDGWSEAYFGHFTVGSGGEGDRPLVVSYATSPPADVFYSESSKSEPDSGNISPADGTFRQIEFVGILKGTEQREAAEELVDFMLSRAFQEDIPLQMFVYPANGEAALPDLFTRFAEVPVEPVDIDAGAIEANRERWIEAWTETVLR
ncbi:MAG: thiamine ABC transporter substrate-binding protein [Chloroflexota bacterium]|nr:thiamine ABC transporter substrate-binding protein [Chloroflexota bacterium]